MQHLLWSIVFAALLPALSATSSTEVEDHKHHHNHHKHHHKHHGHHRNHDHKKKHVAAAASTSNHTAVVAHEPVSVVAAAVAIKADKDHGDSKIVAKMKQLEKTLAKKAEAQAAATTLGHILVNGPLPVDFTEKFSKAVSEATGADKAQVKVTGTNAVEGNDGIVEVAFLSSSKVVKDVEDEAADPDSKLAKGSLHSFLVAKDVEAKESESKAQEHAGVGSASKEEAQPVESKGIDIDTQLPYGDLEPFGREDTAQELTESSVKESDSMVDQLERAEVAEEKRAVFRALTRLRGAAITSFDGVARSQTGNIDEYNKIHQWRKTHPLHHLADEESDVAKWAFPDNADF